jgi:hypothetical protein
VSFQGCITNEVRRIYLVTWPEPFLRRLLWEMSWPERLALEANINEMWAAKHVHNVAHVNACVCVKVLGELEDVLLDWWIDLHDEVPEGWAGNIGMGTMKLPSPGVETRGERR